MEYFLNVEVIQRQHQLVAKTSNVVFTHRVVIFEHLLDTVHQTRSLEILHHNVNSLGIFCDFNNLSDVSMVKCAEGLHFSDEIVVES